MSVHGFKRFTEGMVIQKTPDAILDYGHDWEKWLKGDTIQTSDWTISPTGGLSKVTDSIQAGVETMIWLQNGVIGVKYAVKNTITTVGGRTVTRTFYVELVASLSG